MGLNGPAAQKNALPYLALAGGVVCLTLSPLFVRYAQAPGLVTSFYRMLTAALVLAPFALRGAGPAQGRHLGRAWLLALLGGLFTSLDHAFWSTSLASTSVANAMLFNYIAPLWVALFAALVWRERLRLPFWAGLVLVLAGMALVSLGGAGAAFRFNRGDIFAMASSLFYAGYFLAAQRGLERMRTLLWIWLVGLSAALALLLYSLVLGLPLLGYPAATYGLFFAAGLCSQVGGYFLVAYALKRLPASLVAPSLIAQPVLSALLAIPLYGELLAVPQILGGLAVLGGIYVVNRSKRS